MFCRTKTRRSTSWAQCLRVSDLNLDKNVLCWDFINRLIRSLADFSLKDNDSVTSIDFHALALVKSTLGASNLYEIVLKSIERNFQIVEQNVHPVSRPLKTFVFHPKEIGHFISFVYPLAKENDGMCWASLQLIHLLSMLIHLLSTRRRWTDFPKEIGARKSEFASSVPPTCRRIRFPKLRRRHISGEPACRAQKFG